MQIASCSLGNTACTKKNIYIYCKSRLPHLLMDIAFNCSDYALLQIGFSMRATPQQSCRSQSYRQRQQGTSQRDGYAR